MARNYAEGTDAIGFLSEFDDAYHLSAFLCLELNAFGRLDLWLSKDCSKLWIAHNDALPGELLAAADPDVDLEHFRVRCAGHTGKHP